MPVTNKYPIWKDVYYSSTAYTILDYAVQIVDGETIYYGRTYQRPGESGVKINVARICQDYIKDSFRDVDFRTLTGQTYVHPGAYMEFNLINIDNGNVLGTYGFVYDWSYEEWNGSARNISSPINNHTVTGMYSFQSFSRTVLNTKTEVITQVGMVNSGNSCGEIALYYKNRKGGWDAFLIEGTVTKKDKYTKYTYNRSYNNNTLEFENGTYHSQIITSYQLNTGWLNDQESENLAFNLLSSNEVYLHCLCTNQVYPAVITDNSVNYKTYRNNSRKLVNYRINCDLSQRYQVL